MSQAEWFRKTVWNPTIESEFFERLSRTRSGKAQYLRIQGLTLIETSDPALIEVGISLSRRVVSNYPREQLQIASSWYAIGMGNALLGRVEDGIAAYRKAWEIEAGFPQVRTNARLELAVLLVQQGRCEAADEAIRAIDEGDSDSEESMFPVVAMKKALVRAVTAQWQGRTSESVEHARVGLAAASQQRSPLRNHPTLGVVDPRDTCIELLRRLAGE